MMVRKVLFIHSQGKDEFGSKGQLLPVGLLALADFLVRNNIEARVLHLGLEKRIDPAFSVSDHIQDEAFDMVCLGLHWHWQASTVFDLAKSLKARNRDIKIVLGGFSASYFYREIMDKHPAIDFIIRGDAELPLLFLARELASIHPDLVKVPNLSWREGADAKNNPHDYLIDQELLDNLRFTNFPLLKNHELYLEQVSLSFSEAGRESTFFYVPGRGCSVDCSFCGGSCSTQIRLNRREQPIFVSLTAVIRELAALSEYGISRVYVAFDPYPGKDYYPELFRAIRRAKLELAMDFEAFSLPSEEFIFEFKQTFRPGSTIFISPYTGSDTVRRFNRGMPFSNDGLYACLDRLKKERIKIILGLSAGLAHEDSAGILETMKMIRRIRNEYSDVEMAIEGVALEPGAPCYIRPDEYGINAKRSSLEDFINEAPGGLGYSSGYFSENEINEILALLRAESNCRLTSSRIHEYLKGKGRLPNPFSLDALMGECGGCAYYTECFSSISIKADADHKQEKGEKNDCVLFLPPPSFQFSLPEIGLPQLAAYLEIYGKSEFTNIMPNIKNANNVMNRYSFTAYKMLADDFYPPISLGGEISEEDIIGAWKEAVSAMLDSPIPNRLGLYIHVPYCLSKCKFCFCGSIGINPGMKELEKYIEFLKFQILKYSEIFSKNEFYTLYFGGGTPSLLSAEQLEDLFGCIYDNFNFIGSPDVIFEATPITLNREKVRILKEFGRVTRLDIGVQSMDKGLLDEFGREQNDGAIAEAIKEAQSIGIEYVKCDYIVNLPGQDKASIKKDLDKLCDMAPDAIHLNNFIPLEHTAARDMLYITGKEEAGAEELYDHGDMILKSRGYARAKGTYTKGKDGSVYNAQEIDMTERNASLLGLGYLATSRIYGAYWYEYAPYREGKMEISGYFDKKDFIYFGIRCDKDEEMRKYMINNMREVIDKKEFFVLFGEDPVDYFCDELGFFRKQGILSDSADKLVFAIQSQLDARVYATVFYSRNIKQAFWKKYGEEYDEREDYKKELHKYLLYND